MTQERTSLAATLAEARNMALEEAVEACRKESAEWESGEAKLYARLCIAAIRAIRK